MTSFPDEQRGQGDEQPRVQREIMKGREVALEEAMVDGAEHDDRQPAEEHHAEDAEAPIVPDRHSELSQDAT